MKRALIIFFVLLVTLIGANVQLFAQAANWKDVPIKPLPAFHPLQPKRIVLPNASLKTEMA